MLTRRWWIALAAAACAAACKGGDGAPDCKAAAGAYAALVKKQVEIDQASDPKKKARALSLIPQLKDEMARSCEEAGWSDEARRCITAAKDVDDLERCTPSRQEADSGSAGGEAAPKGTPKATEAGSGDAAPGAADPGGAEEAPATSDPTP